MKKLIAPLLLTGVLLSGCAGAPVAQPSAQPKVPVPTSEQRASLVTELSKVNPGFSDNRVIVGARALCRGILDRSPDAEQINLVRGFFGTHAQSLSEADATKVVAVVKANGFCKKG